MASILIKASKVVGFICGVSAIALVIVGACILVSINIVAGLFYHGF